MPEHACTHTLRKKKTKAGKYPDSSVRLFYFSLVTLHQRLSMYPCLLRSLHMTVSQPWIHPGSHFFVFKCLFCLPGCSSWKSETVCDLFFSHSDRLLLDFCREKNEHFYILEDKFFPSNNTKICERKSEVEDPENIWSSASISVKKSFLSILEKCLIQATTWAFLMPPESIPHKGARTFSTCFYCWKVHH